MTRLIYTKNTSGKPKKSNSKRLEAARAEHARFLEKMKTASKDKRTRTNEPVVPLPDYKLPAKAGVAPVSNAIPGGVVPKVDIFYDHKWKLGKEESEATLAEIKKKAGNVGPVHHKGGYGYTPGPATDYKKQ